MVMPIEMVGIAKHKNRVGMMTSSSLPEKDFNGKDLQDILVILSLFISKQFNPWAFFKCHK